MLPVLIVHVLRSLLLAGGVTVFAMGVAELIDSMNQSLMAGEVAQAEATFERLRAEQDGDLSEFYREHRHRMTPATRARFERELGW
jgi:hypothetical protein